MRHALPALFAVGSGGQLCRRLGNVSTLQPKPTFHLLQPEVWRGVNSLEHDARYRFVLELGRATETRAFANHAVLEMTNLQDALPVGGLVLGELRNLCLQDVTIDERGTRRKEDLI